MPEKRGKEIKKRRERGGREREKRKKERESVPV